MTEQKKKPSFTMRHPGEFKASAEATLRMDRIYEAELRASVGKEMPDGTVYADVSPDTGMPFFLMPFAPRNGASFNLSAARIVSANEQKRHGHADWRLPSLQELGLIVRNKEKRALKDIFSRSLPASAAAQEFLLSSTGWGNKGFISVCHIASEKAVGMGKDNRVRMHLVRSGPFPR